MSLIVALAISALGISVWASFENTHNNSGNQASDIVGVAQTQVGYGEGYDGYTKYGDWYGLPNSDWCAMFVSWCANQAGVDNSVFPSFALCSAGCDWFIQQGRFHYSGSYTPKAGDLIFYASYGNIYHVGLVTGSDGSNVYSIEGNYNEQVCNVSYSLYYGDILGYATPNYTVADSAPVVDTFDDEYSDIYVDTDSEYADSDVDADTDSEYADSDVDVDTDSEYAESDVDADTDSEYAESDVDADSDSEYAESDVDADSDSEYTESDVDVDTDSEYADSDVDSDTDTDSEEQEATDSDEPNDNAAMGDVNGDGVINSFDALLVQRYLVFGDVENINVLKADVNGSGIVDIGDALMILQMSVHLI